MPLTIEQRNALAQVRAYYHSAPQFQLGTAESVDQRARSPDPAHLPTDVTARVEIAPPSTRPQPLLESRGLKAPERVPVYFYSLHSDQAESDVADTHVIFFIHGGGNVLGHPTNQLFIGFFSQLLHAAASHSGGASKCVLVVPSYRLATVPENTFPAALQDILAAYDYVLEKGYKPSNIVLAGESAGGNHAMVLTHLILQSGQPTPRGLVTIAPFAIQVYDQLSEHAKAQIGTDLLTVPMVESFTTAYVGDSGIARTDPLISGAFISFTESWPRTLILTGTGDMLIDTSRELEKRLLALNLPVELVEYDERPHGWCFLSHIFPGDVQDAAQRIAQFVL